jgi:hypothetical protein
VVVAAYNLAEMDGAVGAHTDAYVRVRVGNVVRSSSVVTDSLNPVWPGDSGEAVHLGVFASGTPVYVDVMDADGGFLGADDVVATTVV